MNLHICMEKNIHFVLVSIQFLFYNKLTFVVLQLLRGHARGGAPCPFLPIKPVTSAFPLAK